MERFVLLTLRAGGFVLAGRFDDAEVERLLARIRDDGALRVPTPDAR